MKRMLAGLILAAACSTGALAACGGDDDDDNSGTKGTGGSSGSGATGGSGGSGATGGSGGSGGSGGGGMGDAQTPPQGVDAIKAWLATGSYKSWACEGERHEFRPPSPHGFNRICSNDVLSAAASGTDDWPVGSAGVKELYANETDAAPVGYAVYLKTKADSAGGANWYWYEDVPLDSPVPHDARGVVADGFGDAGPAKTICVGCHAAAGADDEHTPSPGGRDQVYTPVP
jgi:hypothetical protein